jgi:hypothetical protein
VPLSIIDGSFSPDGCAPRRRRRPAPIGVN